MNLFKNIFGGKEEPIKTYQDFWAWFLKHEREFFNVVKSGKDIERGFFNKLSAKLGELKDGYFFLAGMYDEHTVELVFTADGNTSNIVFVEELVEASPNVDSWKFTSLKQALDISDVSIEMGGYRFNQDNLSFYANELTDYPDEIDITIVHDDLTEGNRKQIQNGVYIFLDNYLGELDFLKNIDNLDILGKHEAKGELIPIAKLKDYLIWRQKEFNEKYEGVRYDTEHDAHTVFEGESANGNKVLAVINTGLLNWERKASHPWVAVMTMKYDKSSNNGMPSQEEYALLDFVQEEILQGLRDADGYLNIGRQTANGQRDIYFACKDFREPSKVFWRLQQKYSNRFEIEYDIYKDKYWRSFERFYGS